MWYRTFRSCQAVVIGNGGTQTKKNKDKEIEDYAQDFAFDGWRRLYVTRKTEEEDSSVLKIELILFTQPLPSGRIWHKVDFLSGV